MRSLIYTIPSSVIMQSVDDETLLFDSETELFFALNETGAMFWESITKYTNLSDVYDELSDIFEVVQERLEDDLLTFSALLIQQGLLVVGE